MTGGVIEQKQDGVTFYITPDKVAVATELQVFLITMRNQYTSRPHASLRQQIVNGEIRSLSELCGAMEAHTVMVGYRKEWI